MTSKIAKTGFSLPTREAIRAQALKVGFDAIGISSALPDDDRASRLQEFIRQGYHGDMSWLARNPKRRQEPKGLWDQVKTVIVLGVSYAPKEAPCLPATYPDRGIISVYAQGQDYHKIIKKRLKKMARWLVEKTRCEVKVFVDTAPVMEKSLAKQAGLGWLGKHTNMVSRTFGSWLFLGEIYTNLPLETDKPHMDHCGSCDACLKACPTQAFVQPGKLDARKCISYLTIEHKGNIDHDLMSKMGNRIYGCDDCLAACPWNKFASPHGEPSFFPLSHTQMPELERIASLEDDGFRRIFQGSPIKRTGRDRVVRNALIAIGNSGNKKFMKIVKHLCRDKAPEVRHAARWALERLEQENADCAD